MSRSRSKQPIENMKLNKICVLTSVFVPLISSAQVIYSDNFNSSSDAANYNILQTTVSGGGASSDATFGFDYSTLGVPVAPDTTDSSTLGLRLRVDDLGNTSGSAVGAIEAATIGLTLPSKYVITFDLWGNYIGGTSLSASGSNGSTAPGVGIGTSGTSLQSPNANDGFIADAFHDGGGGSTGDYRLYADNTRLLPTGTSYFAAGSLSTSSTHTDSYYSFLTSQTAPSAQTTLSSSTQGGSTPVGIVGFQWTKWTITQDGTNITWAINGHTIATVPDSSVTFGGTQLSLDSIDSNTSGNTSANNQALNFDIFDNLTVTAIPEPATGAIMCFGAVAISLIRRRTRKS